MKIVVIGGSGLIGSKLVKSLRQLGHEVVSASPKSGINALTGEGLAQALKGAEVLVDVANSPSFEDKAVLEFFKTATSNLLKAEEVAGVRHHVALSIVGTDLLEDCGYFRAKVAQEKLIKASLIPYTIVRSTQFFEFLSSVTESSKDKTIRLSPAFVQPIASDDVAAVLLEVALAKPRNGTIDIAGPDRVRFSELGQRFLKSIQDARKVVADPHALYFGAELAEDTLVPHGKAKIGATNYNEWFRKQYKLV